MARCFRHGQGFLQTGDGHGGLQFGDDQAFFGSGEDQPQGGEAMGTAPASRKRMSATMRIHSRVWKVPPMR